MRAAKPSTSVFDPVVLGILSLLVAPGCESGLKVNRDGGQDLGQDLAPDLGQGSGPDLGRASAQDGPARPDAAPCQGIPRPDVDCYYGTPTYVCVQNSGGATWLFTCPDQPRDAGPDTGHDCDAIAHYLSAQMDLWRGRCTAVVRLDYQSLAIRSHAFVCGQGATTNEDSARKAASAAAVFPNASGAGAGKLMSAPTDHDQWVFYTAPSDFGGVATISDHTGLATFAASIVWSGTGEILYPKVFDDADMGEGCEVPFSPSDLRFRAIDLAGGEAQPRFEDAVRIVLSTALPAATGRLGAEDAVLVLLYPRTVGSFDPTTAEYIVLVNSILLI